MQLLCTHTFTRMSGKSNMLRYVRFASLPHPFPIAKSYTIMLQLTYGLHIYYNMYTCVYINTLTYIFALFIQPTRQIFNRIKTNERRRYWISFYSSLFVRVVYCQIKKIMFGNTGRFARFMDICLAIMALFMLTVMAMPSPDEERYLDNQVRILRVY